MSYNYRAITGSTRISNRPAWMIGGSGLGIGGPPAARRAEQIRAHGRTKHQFSIIKQNTVGGIGGRGPTNSRMFAPTADGVYHGVRGKKIVSTICLDSGGGHVYESATKVYHLNDNTSYPGPDIRVYPRDLPHNRDPFCVGYNQLWVPAMKSSSGFNQEFLGTLLKV